MQFYQALIQLIQNNALPSQYFSVYNLIMFAKSLLPYKVPSAGSEVQDVDAIGDSYSTFSPVY